MRDSTRIALARYKALKDFTTIGVRFIDRDGFPSAITYTYKVPLSWRVKRGTKILVPTYTHKNYTFATVHIVHKTPQLETNTKYDYRWAVCVVKDDTYLERVKQDETALELLRKARESRANAEALAIFKRKRGK